MLRGDPKRRPPEKNRPGKPLSDKGDGGKMQKLAPLFAVIFSAVAISGHAGEKQEVFNYSTQIGVAEIGATGDGCLTIPNPTLREKQAVTLVIFGKPQKVIEKNIDKKLKTSCTKNTETPPDASFYAFPVGKEHFDPAIAVVGAAGDFKVVKGKVRADLIGDGTSESFRACTSNEGLHLTVWAGEALKSKRLWHEYYYLGYDVVPSCKATEYRE
jgi:hypothetical protein